ncbi:MAG: XrtA/PEP-CTERM system TPR-repeat protein PrsT [Pseudomonadota bacterium]
MARFILMITPSRLLMAIAAVGLVACEPSAEDRVSRANEHVASDDYRAAVLEARSALQEEPANIEARLIFANASRQVGDFPTAAAEYGRALELGAELRAFLPEYAESLLVVGSGQQVLSKLGDALEADPEVAVHRSLLGHAYAASGEPERAKAEYERALALDDRLPDAYVGLASLAERASNSAEVERVLADAKTRVPDSAELQLYLAQQAPDAKARATFIERAYAGLDDDASPVTRAQVLLVRVENFLQRDALDQAQAALNEYKSQFPGAPQTLFLQSLIALERGDIDKARAGLLRISEGVAGGSPADLFLGSINLKQKNLRQAEAYLTKALRFDATSGIARKLLAETLLELNRPQEALEVLAALAPEQTSDPSVLALLGQAAVASGNPADGVIYFERSAAQVPDDPGLKLATAYSYLASGRASEALDLLENLEDDAIGGYRGSLLRMLAHLSSNDRAAAIGEAEALVARAPDDATAWSLAGQLMGNLREFPIARQYYTQALSIDAMHTPSRYGLARVELADGSVSKANELLEALLDDVPGYMPAVATVGQIAASMGNTAAAVSRVEAAVAASPEAAEPRFLLAQYQLSAGETEAALASAEAGLEFHPDNPRLLQMRGKARGQLGSEEAARQDLLRAAELAPLDRLMQLDKARVLLNTGDPEAAREVVSEYLEARPGDTVALLFGADLDLNQGAVDRAANAVNAVLDQDPDNRAALILQGDILLQRGDLEGALDRFDVAGRNQLDRRLLVRQFSTRQKLGLPDSRSVLDAWLERNPDDVQIQTVLAQSLDAAGEQAAAISLYEELADRQGTNDRARAIVLNNLAWMYFTAGDARARQTAAQARSLSPRTAAINDTFGWIALSEDDLDTALPALRRANELDRDNPEIAWHLASALSQNGESEQAMRLLGRALQSDSRFSGRDEAEALYAQLRESP